MIWALSTLQKFIPLMFLIITNTPSKPLVLLSLTNLLVRVSTSYTNNDIKWILGSSTLFTLGWVLPLLNITPELSLLYYFLYACMLANFVWVAMTSHPAKGTFNFNSKNYTMSCIYLLGLTLFIIGMPPFLGFLGKISLLRVIAKFSGGLAFCLIFISVYLMYMYISVISQLITLLSLQKANLGRLDSKMSVKGLSARLLVLSLLLRFSSVLF